MCETLVIKMKKFDKTQGVVFVLPKSREFFGRISKDFEKTGLMTSHSMLPEEKTEILEERDEQASDLGILREHLSKLSELHKQLQGLLAELDNLIEKDKED